MLIRKLFQSRFFWFLFALIPLILSINYYYSKFYSLNYNLIGKKRGGTLTLTLKIKLKFKVI